MVFSDTTNKNGIIQDIEVLLNFPDGGVTDDATLFAQITGLVNQSYLKVASYAASISPGWQWDDFNHSGFPRGTATLVDEQDDYTLPVATSGASAATLWRVIGVSVLDSGGNEVKLTPTEVPEAILRERYETSGLPAFYRLVQNSAKLYPAPDSGSVTTANGLIVYFERSPDLFTSADTTQVPGVPEPFHRMISLEAAMDYASARGTQNIQYLQTKLTELRTQLDDFMSNRNKDDRARLVPRRESYR